jgi:hypothetical protein
MTHKLVKKAIVVLTLVAVVATYVVLDMHGATMPVAG